jgi:hypothetical protein
MAATTVSQQSATTHNSFNKKMSCTVSRVIVLLTALLLFVLGIGVIGYAVWVSIATTDRVIYFIGGIILMLVGLFGVTAGFVEKKS